MFFYAVWEIFFLSTILSPELSALGAKPLVLSSDFLILSGPESLILAHSA